MLRGHRSKFLNFITFLSLKIVLILANSADPDEMRPYAAFHLGLHCLPKYIISKMKGANLKYVSKMALVM